MSEEERIEILKSMGFYEPLAKVTTGKHDLMKLMSGDLSDLGILVEAVLEGKENGTI